MSRVNVEDHPTLLDDHEEKQRAVEILHCHELRSVLELEKSGAGHRWETGGKCERGDVPLRPDNAPFSDGFSPGYKVVRAIISPALGQWSFFIENEPGLRRSWIKQDHVC